MRATFCLITGIVALVPALSFGQAPNIFDLKDATKDAFDAASKAFDNIEAKTSKKKSSGPKRGSAAARATAKENNPSPTMFSKLGERANGSNEANVAKFTASAEEQEKQVLSFLGSSTAVLYQASLSLVGLGLVYCVGRRIKEKVKDYTTGRPSLSKSKIVRR